MNEPFSRADTCWYVRSGTCGCGQEAPLLLSPMLSLKFVQGGSSTPLLSRNWVPHDFSGHFTVSVSHKLSLSLLSRNV